LIKTIINETPGHYSGFHDSYFVEDIIPMLKQRGLLPANMGRQLGYGNEAVVFALGSDQTIRLHPTYEDFPEEVDNTFNRMKNAPSGKMYVHVFDVGKIKAYDEERDENVTYAVYATMERLTKLSPVEASTIDDVVTQQAQIDDIEPGPLRDFLEKYVELPVDQDSKNVMKRGDDYVIIDPE
jgi:hypothetical protein